LPLALLDLLDLLDVRALDDADAQTLDACEDQGASRRDRATADFDANLLRSPPTLSAIHTPAPFNIRRRVLSGRLAGGCRLVDGFFPRLGRFRFMPSLNPPTTEVGT